jgi:hypothetical protein
MALAYAKEVGGSYIETSAKDDIHVQNLFVQISEQLPAPSQEDKNIVRPMANLQATSANSSGICC